jgi:hypothetical protein
VVQVVMLAHELEQRLLSVWFGKKAGSSSEEECCKQRQQTCLASPWRHHWKKLFVQCLPNCLSVSGLPQTGIRQVQQGDGKLVLWQL